MRSTGVVKLGSSAVGDFLELPCGRCIGCKLDKRRSWMVRICHEAQLYDSNVFATLTYSEDFLPPSRSLEYRDFQLFVKRLRRDVSGVTVGPDGRRPVRFFVSGEYGEKWSRPHWHAILFNVRFRDSVRWLNGTVRSRQCEELWKKGDVVLGRVTPQSAAYVAGYTMKKVLGPRARLYYEDVLDVRTGELSRRRPEFVCMSLKPGIGAGWYSRFASDVFPVDYAVIDGSKRKVPRYYLERYRKEGDPADVELLLNARYERAMEQRGESTPERRAVREEDALRREALFGGREL